MSLEVGEPYLVIEILNGLKVLAFKNKDKTAENNQPDYKGNGVAVWVNTKKAAEEGKL
jgi:hypothetical protein